MRQIKSLVIGGDGFVGQPFCKFLEEQGEFVKSIDVKQGDDNDVRFKEIDFQSYDHVYVLAWDVGGSKYLYKRAAQFQQLDWNLALLSNLMPQLLKSGKPFLFVSSQLAEETDSVYGVTKRLGEVWTHLTGGINVRLWNVYGSLENTSERSHVICDFIWQALNNKKINMLTNGQELRQFIHINDVCTALKTAMEKNLVGSVYDITSFEWVSILSVAEIIANELNVKLEIGTINGSTPITPIRGRIPGWWPNVELTSGLKDLIKLALHESSK